MASLREVLQHKIYQGEIAADELTDVEDLSFGILILKEGVEFGIHPLGGLELLLGHVDPDSESHTGLVESLGIKIAFDSDQDIFELR